MEATATVLVKRDPREVFEFIADPMNQDQWVDGVSEPRIISGVELGKGTTYGYKYTYDGRTHEMVSEVCLYDPPKAIGVRTSEGPYPFRGMVTLTSDREGTIVSNTIDAEPEGLLSSIVLTVFGPLIRRSMRRQLRKELEVLKEVLERGS